MKVGTDSVILGSWTNIDNVNSVLDIGTGTGLLAIMIAQKCTAKIDAIDIDKSAYIQAKENIKNCSWKDRISLYHSSLEEFVKDNTNCYDLIISNPPYFENSHKAPEKSRNIARHTDNLSHEFLLESINKLLNIDGKANIVLPIDSKDSFVKKANTNNLFLRKELLIYPTTESKPKRVLLEFTREKVDITEEKIIIEKYGRHKYSEEYINLTKDYYLHF